MYAMLLCILPLSGAAEPKKEELVKKEMEKLQGSWRWISGEVRGEKYDLIESYPDNPFYMEVSGNQATFGKIETTIVIDPTTEPKLIDFTYTKEKVTAESIYKLDGDTLTMCWKRGIGKVKERPTEFKADDKSEYEVRVYKREKPKK